MTAASHESVASIRLATTADRWDLDRLIAMSVRGLASEYHTPDEIESSLRYLFGVDSRLIDDGTYYVIEGPDGILASGGWSRRKTPFGGDNAEIRDDGFRDPARDPAAIRAFFAAPHAVRQGLGRMILERCEEECRTAGFGAVELVATRMGLAFYGACGFESIETVMISLPDGVTIEAFRMSKGLSKRVDV